MSEQKFIKTERKEDGNFVDLYEVYTPQGDMLIKNSEGEFETVITYVKEPREQPLNKEVYFNRYKSKVEENNSLVDQLVNLIDKINELEEQKESLEFKVSEVKEKIVLLEELLDEEDLLEVEEIEEEQEEEEEDDE